MFEIIHSKGFYERNDEKMEYLIKNSKGETKGSCFGVSVCNMDGVACWCDTNETYCNTPNGTKVSEQ